MKILVIYNPKSGKNKFEKNIPYITSTFEKHNITDYTLYASTGPNDITRYISENLNKISYDVVFISGGDGTLNEAVNGIMNLEVKPKIAYFPAGTANDVGYMLGIKKSIKKALKTHMEQNVVKMDVCKINNRYFVYASGAGKFIDVTYKTTNRKAKKFFGKIYYFFLGAKQITKKKELNINIKTADKEFSGKYYLFLAITGNRVGAKNIKRQSPAKLNDGKLELILFKQKTFFSIFNLSNFFLFGDKYRKDIDRLSVSEFEITSDESLEYNVDGEYFDTCTNTKFSIEREAIEIFVSKKSKERFF